MFGRKTVVAYDVVQLCYKASTNCIVMTIEFEYLILSGLFPYVLLTSHHPPLPSTPPFLPLSP